MQFSFTLLALLCSIKKVGPKRSLNGVQWRQILPVRVWPFSKEVDIEYMKLIEAKEARFAQSVQFNQTMALQHLKLNQTMALQHLKLNLQLNQQNKNMYLSFTVVVLIVSGFSQCSIYIRDGLLGKKSGELAFYTSISIIVNQFTQGIKAIWDLGILKALQVCFQRVLKVLSNFLNTGSGAIFSK